MFGQQQNSGLFSNVSSAPTFGATTTAGATSLFGTQPATSGGLFGAKPAGSLFGTTTTQQSGNIFGQQPSTSTAFGGGGGLFGANKPATSAFGQTTQPSLFGQPPQQSTTGGLFGAPAPSTGAFGTATTTTTPSLFGGITQFGQQPAQQAGGIFGPKPAQPPTFGGSFGGTQQPAFGSATGGSSIFGDAVKFSPPTGSDTMQLQGKPTPVSTKQMCISAMKEYESKSLEELRVADYLAGRKVNANAPAGSTLFGQQNQPQNSGLFGSALSKPATGGLFSNTQSFGATTTAGNTSLFGTQPATSGGLFGAKPAGSLFGTTTTQQSGNIFGQQPSTSTAFGGGGGLFGANKPATSAFGQTTQPSLFGQPPQQSTTGGLFGAPAPSTGAFGTATTTTTPSLFGGIPQFGQQQPQQAGGIFGPKPAQQPTFGSFGGGGNQTAFGSTTGGSIFGTNAPKIGGGIFGAQPQTGGGMFGSAGTGLMQKPAQSLFGPPQPTQQGTLFGGNVTQQTFGSPTMGGGTSPIYLGSPNLNATIQQAIIDAQLSTLPYGDSPLLKSSVSPKKSPQDISRLQKQLELGTTSRKIYDDKLLSPPTNGIMPTTTTTNVQQEASTKDSSALDLNGSLLDSSFGYKPMVLLPSVGFGAALGLHPSPKLIKSKISEKSLSDKSSFLNRTTAPSDENRIKSLDMSVVIGDERPTNASPQFNTPQQFNVSQQTNEITSPLMPTRILPIENFPQPIFDKTPETIQTPQHQQQSPQPNISQTPITTTTTTATPPAKKYRIKLTHPEYYTEPTLVELEELFNAEGICRLEGGLTVGRLGYGSVFWKGPIELREQLNLDEIVHFRNKEVVVYPDDSTKPEIGCGLNKQAEVSLERIWPINPKTKQMIKDPDELRRMGFREKLERLCQRMDATFRDYQPQTGTWSFEVQHFSKYGFLEDNEDEYTMGGTGTSQAESDALKHQAHQRALVQNAKVPLREIQKSLEGTHGGGQMHKNGTTSSSQFSNAKRMFAEREQQESNLAEGDEEMTFDSKEYMDFNEDSKLFQDEIIRKKFKFDDALFDSKKLLERIAEKEEGAIASRRQSKLVERSPKNVFKGLSALNISKSNSLLAKVGIHLDRRSCRIGFSQGLLFSGLNQGSHENTVKIQKATVIPTIKNYFTQFVYSKQGIEVQKLLEQLENSELIHFNPPSPLLNYLDTFVVNSFANGRMEEIEKAISEICSILLTNSESIEEKITQRIQMGNWLHSQLVINKRPRNNTTFGLIFHHLINGSINSAIKIARQAHHYNLALILSLFKSPSSRMIREQAEKQLNSINRRNSDPDYVRIFELISGQWTKTKGGCLEDLDWLQILGILIWYHSSPTTTLIECIDALEDLMKK